LAPLRLARNRSGNPPSPVPPPLPPPIDTAGSQRFLLVQLAAMGDVILCTPALRALRQAFPDSRIDFLTRGPGLDALAGNPYLDQILAYPTPVRQRLELVRRIRQVGYDVVVDFHSNPRTAQVVALSGARFRIGWRGRGPRNLAYTHLMPKERIAGSYSAWRKVDMLQLLRIDTEPDGETDLELDVAVGPSDRAWAAETWTRLGVDGERPVVAISAVSREAFKNWGADRWASLADSLIDAGARVLLTNGPGELPQVEAVVRHMQHAPAWNHGPTTVRQLAALLERCAFWIGNDGGPKHVAVAAGLVTITLFRWRLATIWTDARPGTRHRFFERAPPQGCDLACQRCAHLGCLRAIEVDEVLAVALDLLDRASSSGSGRRELRVIDAPPADAVKP
jgi:heptosyltransferase-3